MQPEYMTAYARMFPDPEQRVQDTARNAHESNKFQRYVPEPGTPNAGVPVLNGDPLRFEVTPEGISVFLNSNGRAEIIIR